MSQIAPEISRAVAQLGQLVRLAARPSQRPGYVVAVMVAEPYEALVRWTDAEPTFEALDGLIDVHRAALTDRQRPELGRQGARMVEGALQSGRPDVDVQLSGAEWPPTTRQPES